MAKGHVLPKLDIGRGSVRQLRSRNAGSEGRQTEPVPDVVPEHGPLILSNGRVAPQRKELPETREGLPEKGRIHLALVVPDLKVYGSLKDSVYILKPTGFDQEVLVHVLVQRRKQSKQEVVFGFALTQLGLVEPSVAKLQYPEELEIGWSDATAPINTEEE